MGGPGSGGPGRGGGRKPLPQSKRKAKQISCRITFETWDKLNTLALQAGYTSYQAFLRDVIRALPQPK